MPLLVALALTLLTSPLMVLFFALTIGKLS